MQKISFILFIFFAQQAVSQLMPLQQRPEAFAIKQGLPHETEKSGNTVFIQYDNSDELLFSALHYSRSLYLLNARYDTFPNALTYAIVAFDTLISDDNTYSFSYNDLGDVTIDSISVQVGHENNSGLADTIILDLLTLDTNGYPTLFSYWSDTLITSAGLSPGNQFTQLQELRISLGTSGIPVDTLGRMALQLRYRGALADTFALVAGHGTDSVSCALSGNLRSRASHFPQNSLVYWTFYNNLIPTAVGGDVYEDCDANFAFDPAIDGANPIQNWAMGLWISGPDLATEPVPSDPAAFRFFPNPAHDFLNAQFTHPGTFTVTDLAGKIMLRMPVTESAVLNLVSWPSGLYFLAFENETTHSVEKLVLY